MSRDGGAELGGRRWISSPRLNLMLAGVFKKAPVSLERKARRVVSGDSGGVARKETVPGGGTVSTSVHCEEEEVGVLGKSTS